MFNRCLFFSGHLDNTSQLFAELGCKIPELLKKEKEKKKKWELACWGVNEAGELCVNQVMSQDHWGRGHAVEQVGGCEVFPLVGD